MSFRKAVAQAYCLHEHIVNEYHYEQHVWGAELARSQLSRKKGRGADCAFSRCNTFRSCRARSEECVRACDHAVPVPLLLRHGGD